MKRSCTEEENEKAAQIQRLSPVDHSLEFIDPNPNIHHLFMIFDTQFFWGTLKAVEVKWSPRMTMCAGICRYQTRSGYCTIGLSKPLLTLRSRKDLVETLLHEMIHAYLFVTQNNRDRDGHGPNFHKHMYRINRETGASISVYHTFHDEVRAQKVHVWRCEGVCKTRPPFYGYVRRSMNRKPGPHDTWHTHHQQICGGRFVKILEPPGYKNKKVKSKKEEPSGNIKITTMFQKSPCKTHNFVPFSGTGFTLRNNNPTMKLKTKKTPTKNTLARTPTKDIASFFTKTKSPHILDLSDDDDLLILSPPKKKMCIGTQRDQEVVCPVCNKSGFSDIQIHTNLCLNEQLLETSSKASQYPKALDVSVEEIFPSTQEDLLPLCQICGKPVAGDLLRHINICIASIPGDDNIDMPRSNHASSHSNHASSRSNTASSHSNTASSRSNTASSRSNTASSHSNTASSHSNTASSHSNHASSHSNTASSHSNTASSHSNTASSRSTTLLSDIIKCPICTAEVDQSRINPHLDICYLKE